MTVDKLGRKPLQIIGALGMAIGSAFSVPRFTLRHRVLALLSMLFYVAAFAMSWGPVCWVLLSEIFPNAIRGKALAIAVAAQWLANYFVSWTFPMIEQDFLAGGPFPQRFLLLDLRLYRRSGSTVYVEICPGNQR